MADSGYATGPVSVGIPNSNLIGTTIGSSTAPSNGTAIGTSIGTSYGSSTGPSHGNSYDTSNGTSSGTSNEQPSLMDVGKANVAAAIESATNGPVVQNVKEQTQKTTDELSNLAAARKTPSTRAVTGQPLTHYHSFFTELLSWNNPRASAIAYALIISSIFAFRYLDVVRWGFKLTWMVLGVTIAAEVAGKLVLNNGLASQVRPRKYYVLPRESIDASVGDVHELINFFVIETQRIVFAENVPRSILTAIAAFLSYYLVKIVPYWGLAVIATTIAFFAPLIYSNNQEMIDNAIHHVSEIIGDQSKQIRDVASKHTSQATEITKQYVGDYTAKAQQILGVHPASPEQSSPEAPYKNESSSWNAAKVEPATRNVHPKVEPIVRTVPKSEPTNWNAPPAASVKVFDFPAVPTREPAHAEKAVTIVSPQTGEDPLFMT